MEPNHPSFCLLLRFTSPNKLCTYSQTLRCRLSSGVKKTNGRRVEEDKAISFLFLLKQSRCLLTFHSHFSLLKTGTAHLDFVRTSHVQLTHWILEWASCNSPVKTWIATRYSTVVVVDMSLCAVFWLCQLPTTPTTVTTAIDISWAFIILSLSLML